MNFRKFHLTFLFSLSLVSNLAFATEIDSEAGKSIIKALNEAIEQDTTSLRQEFKSVITEDVFSGLNDILTNELTLSQNRTIAFQLRDQQVLNGKNSTFTFYGKRIYFANGKLKTSVKLRARFYLENMDDGSVNLSPAMKKGPFLEIKVKNPAENLENVVNKYRVRISYEDLITLFASDVKDPGFPETLSRIEQNVKDSPFNKKNQNLIPIFFQAMRDLIEWDANFINPELGIYYERQAYRFIESSYESEGPSDTCLFENVDYQVTVDRNILGYFSQPKFQSSFNFLDYFRFGLNSTSAFHYPKDSMVLETKIPLNVGKLKKGKRSELHRFLEREFIRDLRKNALEGKFLKPNRGKASYLRKLAQVASEED